MSNCQLNIIQPVLVKSLADEFMFAEPNSQSETPATAGTHLLVNRLKLCAEHKQGIAVAWVYCCIR